ncbi:MAG: VanW family protein [Bacilli bacterium]|nr:VanW family protein [Bacilli bacterium]
MLKRISNKEKLIILVLILVVLIVSYISLVVLNIQTIRQYNNKILPNIYVEDLELSDYTYKQAKERIKYYNDNDLTKVVKFKVNDSEYEYLIRDIGLSIDPDKTLDQIKQYQDGLGYSGKLMAIHRNRKMNFKYIYNSDVGKLTEAINSLKAKVDRNPVNGHFETVGKVSYVKGVDGYKLDVNKSIEEINKNINTEYRDGIVVNLVGETTKAYGNDSYATIDTMTSAFVTEFMPNTYLRNINLATALGYINGTVVEPGQVFSYCDKAGPFNKSGYVFYYEFVGNGVCQIATTTYNAALLGGLEIVKRYPHDKKSLYVAGGLDATVASYSSGWCVDMQFKNTYKYPIYIKAYPMNGEAHVEFWSNSNAKEGKEYRTSSTQIGRRGYKSYLHTYKDGKEIDVHEIATTWYLKD